MEQPWRLIAEIALLCLLLGGSRLLRRRSRRARTLGVGPGLSDVPPRLTGTQLWALAAAANLARRNNDGCERLRLGAGVEPVQAMLRESWDVQGPADAEPMLDWLAREGHTEQFKEALSALAAVPPAKVEGWLARQQPEVARRCRFAQQHRAEIKNGKLIAWDLVRLINLARAMVTAGWLPEAAAWKHILPAARRLQREYQSWEELSGNFMLGRLYWGEGGATQVKFDAAAVWLLSNPDSPWRRLAWTTPLGSAGR